METSALFVMSVEKVSHDYDPLTGVWTETYVDEDSKMHVVTSADVEPLAEYTTKLRNADAYSKAGIKNGLWHVCSVSIPDIAKLKQIGVDIWRATPSEIVAGLRALNHENFITTRGRV